MTLAQLKLFFRTLLKVVAGGPAVGTPGHNRTAGVLSALDALADFAADQAGGVTAAQLAVVATSLPLRPTRTGDYTLVAADLGAIVPVSSSGTAVTLTIPTGLGQAAPTGTDTGAAKVCYPLQVGTGLLTLAPATGVTLLTRPGGGLKSPGQNGRLVLIWQDTNTVLVEGGVA